MVESVESVEAARAEEEGAPYRPAGAGVRPKAFVAVHPGTVVGGAGIEPTYELNLVVLIKMLWRHRYLVSAAVILFGGIAAYIAFTLPRTYHAEVVTTQVNNQAEGASALARRLSDFVGAGALTLSNDDTTQYAISVLESRRLVEEFIQRNDLLPVLTPGAARPDMWRAVRLFQRDVLVIRQDARKQETTVGIEWPDPVVAAHWANGFIGLANELIRTRALDEAQRNINYLERQVEHLNDVELRGVMFSLIQNESKNLMLANERAEYAFRVIDPAVPPEIPSGPHRRLMVAAGLILGFLLSGLVAYVRTYLLPQLRR